MSSVIISTWGQLPVGPSSGHRKERGLGAEVTWEDGGGSTEQGLGAQETITFLSLGLLLCRMGLQRPFVHHLTHGQESGNVGLGFNPCSCPHPGVRTHMHPFP